MLNEIEIVTSAQQGDSKAFEKLFTIYSQSSIRTAFLITKNQHTSEDIVQETFVKCYKSLKNLKDPAMFKSWFYKMLIRSCWRYTKKEKTQIPVEDIPQGTTTQSIDEILGTFENAQEVYRALSKVSQNHRTVIVLYYYNDMSVKEIAKITGCFEGTVKSRLHNGRKQLKKELLKHKNTKFFREECIL